MSSTFGNWWFGLVVWIPGIPENERDRYMGVSLESQQFTHSLNHATLPNNVACSLGMSLCKGVGIANFAM